MLDVFVFFCSCCCVCLLRARVLNSFLLSLLIYTCYLLSNLNINELLLLSMLPPVSSIVVIAELARPSLLKSQAMPCLSLSLRARCPSSSRLRPVTCFSRSLMVLVFARLPGMLRYGCFSQGSGPVA